VLSLDICEEHPWEVPQSSVARLFVDARGYPPRHAVACDTVLVNLCRVGAAGVRPSCL